MLALAAVARRARERMTEPATTAAQSRNFFAPLTAFGNGFTSSGVRNGPVLMAWPTHLQPRDMV